MRLADHPRKLGLLLLPLIPLATLGVVELVNQGREQCTCTAAPPAPTPHVSPDVPAPA